MPGDRKGRGRGGACWVGGVDAERYDEGESKVVERSKIRVRRRAMRIGGRWD